MGIDKTLRQKVIYDGVYCIHIREASILGFKLILGITKFNELNSGDDMGMSYFSV